MEICANYIVFFLILDHTELETMVRLIIQMDLPETIHYAVIVYLTIIMELLNR